MSTNTDVPENAAEHCPGTLSENAGKANACAGIDNPSSINIAINRSS